MSLQLSAKPYPEPLSLTETKLHLREDVTAQDALIRAAIKAAREKVETDTHRALITQTWVERLDAFPAEFKVHQPPLQSVTSITYTDTSGDTQTLSSSVYTVDIYSLPGRIVTAYGESWPSTRDVPNAVAMTFVAGYGDDRGDVPRPLRQAMLLLVGAWYENREDVVSAPNYQVLTEMVGTASYNNLIYPYKVPRF